MDNKIENLLNSLDQEIDKKCNELKKKKRDKRNIMLFTFICSIFICLPMLLLFAGINILTAVITVVIILSFNLLILSPIILNNLREVPYNGQYE